MPNWQLKNLEVLGLDPKLIEVAEAVRERFNLDIITSAYRAGDAGVHGTMPVRGLDLRCHHPVVGEAVEKFCRERWVYDPDRPWKDVALHHDVGQGPHLHLQVHPNTVRREK